MQERSRGWHSDYEFYGSAAPLSKVTGICIAVFVSSTTSHWQYHIKAGKHNLRQHQYLRLTPAGSITDVADKRGV